jgi:hypothetical protein
MITRDKILDFIGEMGLLSENRTHMITQITILPFEDKINVVAITGMESKDTASYFVPVFNFEKEDEKWDM